MLFNLLLLLVVRHLFLVANIVTTSKALVTTSVALVITFDVYLELSTFRCIFAVKG